MLTCEDYETLGISDVRASRHWEKPVKKTIYTLNIGNYAPKITELTYPLIAAYARKIGADFQVITERKFPDYPVVYEKLQIFELAKESGNDWTIYIDSDTLVHPDFFDPSEHVGKDTVVHNGKDMAGLRWKYDQYFRRDGRNLGSCNWFAMASDWCLDLWRPLDDLTLEEAVANINPTVGEYATGLIPAAHLIDDYTLSRNIAKYGLKHTTMIDICGNLGMRDERGAPVSPLLFHLYNLAEDVKLERLKATLKHWGVA